MTDRNALAPRANANLTIAQPPAPPPAIERLHALVRAGYRPDIGTPRDTDLIVLRHAARAPDLVLHGDGAIEGFDGRRPRYKRMIEPPARIGTGNAEEELRFHRFLHAVPRPSLRDRTRRWRHRYLYFPAVLLAVWGACLTLTIFVMEM